MHPDDFPIKHATYLASSSPQQSPLSVPKPNLEGFSEGGLGMVCSSKGEGMRTAREQTETSQRVTLRQKLPTFP